MKRYMLGAKEWEGMVAVTLREASDGPLVKHDDHLRAVVDARPWTGWAIEYRNGDFNFVDPATYASTRRDAWLKWRAESVSGWHAERRAGKYRAVKMSLTKVS